MKTEARLLVVESSMALRHLVHDLLSEAGFTAIDEASDGSVAIEMLREVPYDLVITNWAAPRLDGRALVSTIHRWPARHHTPVLVLSDQSGPEREVGVSGVVSMPFRAGAFLGEVQRLLSAEAGGAEATPLPTVDRHIGS